MSRPPIKKAHSVNIPSPYMSGKFTQVKCVESPNRKQAVKCQQISPDRIYFLLLSCFVTRQDALKCPKWDKLPSWNSFSWTKFLSDRCTFAPDYSNLRDWNLTMIEPCFISIFFPLLKDLSSRLPRVVDIALERLLSPWSDVSSALSLCETERNWWHFLWLLAAQDISSRLKVKPASC